MATSHNRQFGGTHLDHLSKSQLSFAKPCHYFSRGCGRDGYIEHNNGGLYLGYNPGSATTVGTFSMARIPDGGLCSMLEKRVRYTSNGTGRDSYIK